MSNISFDFNVKDYNLESATTDGFAKLETGWYKMVLAEVGETVPEKSNTGIGATFTFRIVEGPCSGLTFRKWFCVQATQASAKWRQTNFENYVVRIAQCVGVEQLRSVDQLFEKPFFAYITCKEREYLSNQTDRDGNFITKKTTDIDFAKGKLLELILSCKEYAAQNDEDFEDITL